MRQRFFFVMSFDLLTNNIKFYGELDYCIFRKGYFQESLKHHHENIDFLFLDVDLVESTSDCIKFLWNYLKDDSYVYTDDACDIDGDNDDFYNDGDDDDGDNYDDNDKEKR